MMNKALNTEADSIILDLEDAVSMEQKSEARQLVKKYIKKFKEHNIEILVRINDITTKDGVLDLEAIVEEVPDAIIVPKAEEDKITTVHILLNATEMRYDIPKESIKIIPLLETSNGIMNIMKILNVSSRITGIQFGAEDFTNELGVTRTVEGHEIDYARSTVVLAGNAFKVDIIDTPFTNIHDQESLVKDTEKAKDLGFTGKACIHPKQIKVVNEIFTPNIEEVEKAKQLLKVFDEALKSGQAVCTFEGAMIDKPIAERAKRLVDKYTAISNK